MYIAATKQCIALITSQKWDSLHSFVLVRWERSTNTKPLKGHLKMPRFTRLGYFHFSILTSLSLGDLHTFKIIYTYLSAHSLAQHPSNCTKRMSINRLTIFNTGNRSRRQSRTPC